MTRAEARTYLESMKRAYAELDRLAASTGDRTVMAMVRAQGVLIRQLERIVADIPDLAGMSVQDRLVWYSTRVGRLDALVRASGYHEAAGLYVRDFERMAALAEKLVRAGGASGFGTVPAEFVRALQQRQWDRFVFLGREAALKLDDVFLDLVIGGASRSTMLAELRGVITGEYPWGDKTGLYEWHAGTYARTNAHRTMQAFANQQAQEAGLERFLYVGPLDAKTREFCAPLVGHTFTREEIDEMDNGQSADVFSDGGGWNCRHEWVGVTDELAAAVEDDPGEFEDVFREGE